MKFEIKKDKKGYYIINKISGKTYSKIPLTEEDAKKQYKILNKNLYILEASGLNKEIIKTISESPLTDTDILKYLPNVKIISHQDLKNYKSINQLLPKKTDVVIIIYESKPNSGHWVILCRYDNIIEYFDSYGNPIDEPLKWINEKYKNKIDNTPYLTNLLKKEQDKYEIVYNSKDFQNEKKNIATCGRHCVFRCINLLNNNQDLSNYIKSMNEMKDVTGFNYDDIVSNIITI